MPVFPVPISLSPAQGSRSKMYNEWISRLAGKMFRSNERGGGGVKRRRTYGRKAQKDGVRSVRQIAKRRFRPLETIAPPTATSWAEFKRGAPRHYKFSASHRGLLSALSGRGLSLIVKIIIMKRRGDSNRSAGENVNERGCIVRNKCAFLLRKEAGEVYFGGHRRVCRCGPYPLKSSEYITINRR